jgi:uncharacterized protein
MEEKEKVIEIHELKPIDLRNGIIVDGFPSVGLVSSIVANYLISMMNLEQIGIVDSPYFPTISLIRNREPNNPVRIYGGKIDRKDEEPLKIAVFVSEFQPPSNLIKPIAVSMLDWAQKQRASLVVSPEGLAPEDGDTEQEPNAYAVGSTIPARLYFEPHEDIKPFDEGVITGVAGVLLNEGKKRNFNVISILSEAHEMFPDARAAARVIEAMDEAILHMNIDTKPLHAEAEVIENSIKKLQQQKDAAEKIAEKRKPLPPMYG